MELKLCMLCVILKTRFFPPFPLFQGQVMFRNGERMGTIKFNQFQGISGLAAPPIANPWLGLEVKHALLHRVSAHVSEQQKKKNNRKTVGLFLVA